MSCLSYDVQIRNGDGSKLNDPCKQVGTGPRTRIISTQGLASMRDNIVTVFGSRTAEALVALDESSTDGISMHGCASYTDGKTARILPLIFADCYGLHFFRFVSRASASFGKLAGERHYFFLNGRPVNLPKASPC
jgi:DNA mismatch repair protein PMS2